MILSQASQLTHWNLPESTADSGTRVVAVNRGGIRSADEVQHVLFGAGSLRGTELDGEWGVDTQGQPPCLCAAVLAPAQQHAAFTQWLDSHFSAPERLRVQALLGL